MSIRPISQPIMHDKRRELPTILLTGANGQLGVDLARHLAPMGHIVACTRREMDLSSPDDIRRVVRLHRPDVIVNAAAYTDVDGAESRSELATAINGTAPGVLAEEARSLGSLLVHYSTDYVFDGEKRSPYLETDEPRPLSVYGRSKLAGERAILDCNSRALVLRTAWLAGTAGNNFAKAILQLARTRQGFSVVTDQMGTPTTTEMVAGVTTRILAQYWLEGRSAELPTGTYHLTATGCVSRYDYAVAVLRHAEALGMPLMTAPEAVRAVSSAEYSAASPYRKMAVRPNYSVLSTAKLQDMFGILLPDWHHGIHELVASWGAPRLEVATWH